MITIGRATMRREIQRKLKDIESDVLVLKDKSVFAEKR